MAPARRSLLAAALARLDDCPVGIQSTTGGNSRPLPTPLLFVDSDSDALPGPMASSSCNSDSSRAASLQPGFAFSFDAADVAAVLRATADGRFMDIQRERIVRAEAGLPPKQASLQAVVLCRGHRDRTAPQPACPATLVRLLARFQQRIYFRRGANRCVAQQLPFGRRATVCRRHPLPATQTRAGWPAPRPVAPVSEALMYHQLLALWIAQQQMLCGILSRPAPHQNEV